jgi:hypothetical protein
MRTIIFVLVSFILVIAFQQCNKTEDNFIFNNSNLLIKDSVSYDELKCKPCCNNGKPTDCNEYINGISLLVGDPPHDICIPCQCCLDIHEYFGNPETLPPDLPENIVNIVGCDETLINK